MLSSRYHPKINELNRNLIFFLDNRTMVLYWGTMKEKRTIQTVQKSIAAFFRENRRMPSFAEMVGFLDVKSKSVPKSTINIL